MISAYYRPKSIDEALGLLSDPQKRNVPLGGGSVLARQKGEQIGVVDLQALPLNEIKPAGNFMEVGATATLQDLYESLGLQDDLKRAIYHETSFNTRQKATVAGALVTADGRSSLASALLALDADLTWLPGPKSVTLGSYYGLGEGEGALITSVRIPLNVKLRVDGVGRTPLDRPVILVAVAQWPAGRTRIVLGGWGKRPTLALDGPESSGIAEAVHNAASSASDGFASSEYRLKAAEKILQRLMKDLAESDGRPDGEAV